MPASRFVVIVVTLLLVSAFTVFPGSPKGWKGESYAYSATNGLSGLNAALQWLSDNQSSDGSYGAYYQHWTAAAAYALWLNNSNSAKAALSYSYLATEMNYSLAWFWGVEADVPSAVLYSIASSHNLPHVNAAFVKGQILQLQNSTTGGFEGYSYCASNCSSINPVYLTVASSVDTDMSLLGLAGSNLIPAQNRTLAIQYLLSLQNSDGSFNLTRTRPFDSIYSLGPDTASITALTLLALKSVGFTIADASISSGLKFLSEALLTNFCGNGHVYPTAASALAFKAYDQPYEGALSAVYILSQQNSDRGFSDSSRSSYPQSDALDTGWAAIALETQSTEQGRISSPLNCPPVAAFSFNPQEPTPGVAVHFNAATSTDPDTDQLSYNWTFGDGFSAEGVNPTHAYAEAGNFTVTLTALDSGTNPGPLSNTKSLTITIQPTTIQNSSTLPISTALLWIVAGTIGGLAIIGIAFYLGRRSARSSTVHRA